MNFFVTNLLAALVPLIVGFVWYHPKVFGTAWMKATGITPESGRGPNMALVFGLTYVLGFLLAVGIDFNVIHQIHLFSIVANDLKDPNGPQMKWLQDSFTHYGHNFRSFRHGAFHGVEFSLLIVLPLVAINAMFERRGFKYIAITVGYWTLCAVIMGAFICHFLALGVPTQ